MFFVVDVVEVVGVVVWWSDFLVFEDVVEDGFLGVYVYFGCWG